MSGYSIGVNAMRTAMQLMNIAADNIANANTPGYHAKTATVVPIVGPTIGNISQGLGSDISGVQRLCDELIERAILAHTQTQQALSEQTNALSAVESLFSEPSDNGLDKQIGDFFESINSLSASPQDSALREQVVQKAVTICDTLNQLSQGLSLVQSQAVAETYDTVDQINSLTTRIAALNQQVREAKTSGGDANSLLDNRDQLVSQLAQLTDITVYQQPFGVVNVSSGGMLLVSGTDSTSLQATTIGDQVRITVPGDEAHPLDVREGKLGGQLNIANDMVPQYQDALDGLANSFRRAVNLIQTTGVGSTGGFQSLEGENAFTSDLPVSDLGYGIEAGTNEKLIVNVTDTATGEVTQHELTLDTTQSASDFVAALAGAINTQVGHVNATVLQGRLNLNADSGYTFDFATPYDPNPAGTFTGANPTAPTILDAFTGTQDLTYHVTFQGSGTIGTDPLTLQVDVTDAGGTVVNSFTRNIDSTYTPGDAIILDSGLKLTLSAGDVADGDNFSVTAHATTDTAGVLDALGLNVLFAGVGANGIHVSNLLAQDPTQLAAAQSGTVGDNHNLLRLLAMRDGKTMTHGTETIEDYYRSIVADVASHKTAQSTQLDAQTQQISALENQRDSVSGVSVNEQMLNIMQTRQIYEGALKYIQTLDQMLTDLATTI